MDVRWRYVVAILFCSIQVCQAPVEIVEASLHTDGDTDLNGRDGYDGDPRDTLIDNPGQHGRIEPVDNRPRTNGSRVITNPTTTNDPVKHSKTSGSLEQKLPIDTKTTPGIVLPNRLPAIPSEDVPAVLSPNHMQTVLASAQDLANTIEQVKGQFKKDVFAMRVKVTDLIANNFFSEKKVSEMEDLLQHLALDKSSLDIQLAALDKEILAMHTAFTQLPEPNNQTSLQLEALQKNYEQNMRVLQECIQEALDLYENLAYTLASAQQDILNKDFFIDVYNQLKNPSRAKSFFTASKTGALATLENPTEHLMTMTERTVKIVVAEESKNILTCFFLAQELGKLNENVELLTQAVNVFKQELVENPSFEVTIEDLKERVKDLQKEHESAECPLVEAKKNMLLKKVQTFFLQIEDMQRKHSH